MMEATDRASALNAREEPAPRAVFDMHCHLDFAPDVHEAGADAQEQLAGAFSVTVSPAGYVRAARELDSFERVRVGLGLHPWWIADGTCEDEVALFERLAPCERFIGEVGLDFGREHAARREAQLATFDRVVSTCADGGKVISIHAVRAVGATLDVLERRSALAGNVCIFHRFAGTSDELHRAVRLGCRFSINPKMLASKRGRAYARSIPEDLLLLETDEPSGEGAAYDAHAARLRLESMIDELAALRRAPRFELAARIAHKSAELLS